MLLLGMQCIHRKMNRVHPSHQYLMFDLLVSNDHCRYLPGISPAQPGLKIAFQRENLLAQFPDAFEPYLHFGVTLRQPLQGTLFRFPLR